jgi:hypothetical protein
MFQAFRMRSGHCDLHSLRVHRPVGLVLGGGGGATLAALPMPLGSLTELLLPPTLPGPAGTPLTPVVPAPAEPAFGVPTALPDPAGAPVLWANELKAPVKPMAAASARVVRVFDIGYLLIATDANGANDPPFPAIAGFHRALNWRCPVDNPGLGLCVALPVFVACYDARIRSGLKSAPSAPARTRR